MTIKDILVLIDAHQQSTVAADFALSLADQCDAKLTVAGLVLEIQAAPIPSYISTVLGDFPPMWAAAETARQNDAVDAAYKRVQLAAVSDEGTELVRLRAAPGLAQERFARLARHFDLTVIGKGETGYNSDEETMTEAALFRSGRPVFVVPYIQKGAAKLNRAIVAWDGGSAAARAVADALPLLAMAQTVLVVSIGEGQAELAEFADLPGFNITRHLARHGVQAELRTVRPSHDPGSALLSLAADESADYLVMGGYGHSRLREFLLGGTTRTILESMTLPVFLSH